MKVGNKIELVSTTDKYPPVQPGAKGKIKAIEPYLDKRQKIKVDWENKQIAFSLIIPQDVIKILS
jgi:hypothetical protein